MENRELMVGDRYFIKGNIYQVKRVRKVMMAGRVAFLSCDAIGDRTQRLVHQSQWDDVNGYWISKFEKQDG